MIFLAKHGGDRKGGEIKTKKIRFDPVASFVLLELVIAGIINSVRGQSKELQVMDKCRLFR